MGKKLTIFMLDGNPSGPMTVEIGNWSGKAVYSPRGSLKELLRRDEFDSVGIYLLKSTCPGGEHEDAIYIGETERLRKRLQQHMARRDFEAAVCFISKDSMLTKAHVKYLEARLLELVDDAGVSLVENDTRPPRPRLSEADIADMEYFIQQMQIVLPTVGFRSFLSRVPDLQGNEVSKDPVQKVYQIKRRGLQAQMVESQNGFIVLKGSQAEKCETDSLREGWRRIRASLKNNGTLIENGEKLTFQMDTLFNSPSAASSVVSGSQSPGPIAWIDEDGTTYKENQEKDIEGI